MQFITTDQRIAVENFEVGMIYTVTFSNGNNFTGSCIGIGPDFVAFQRTAPELLFCLTMAAAADVASIDPLGSDIGKILEYTGSVPISIKTDGSPLLDYLITGNTVQSGTPTPENPIFPQGCGELDSGQYKIPISSADTTTPVYLGEVESTRLVKKVVYDGTESWNLSKQGNNTRAYTPQIPECLSLSPALCTHFDYNVANVGYPRVGEFVINSSKAIIFGVDGNTFADVDAWEAYLADQYAAGTPVCVWYVLAEPTTGIVNEPLMRIGDYADTLSYRQSGVNVPTTDGLNIFDIDTTVKPSEVYLKYLSPLL